MPVPLLDLRAQHATIRDEVLPAIDGLVDSQLFILGAPVEQLEREVAELSHTKYADRLRERHGRAAARAAGARLRSRATKSSRRRSRSSRRRARFTTSAPRRCSSTSIRRRSTSAPTPRPPRARRAPRPCIPVDLFGQMAPIEEVADGAAGHPGDRRRRADHRRAPVDRRRMAHGRRGRDDRHVQLLPVEEPRRVRRRRHDGHAGRGARRRASSGCACTAARSMYFHDEVGFNSRLDALQAAVLSAKLPHLAGVERQAPRERGVLRRGVRRPRRRDARRSSIRPTSRSSTSTRFASSGATSFRAYLKERGIGYVDLLSAAAASAAVLRVPRLQGRAAVRSRSARRTKCCRCRSIPS